MRAVHTALRAPLMLALGWSCEPQPGTCQALSYRHTTCPPQQAQGTHQPVGLGCSLLPGYAASPWQQRYQGPAVKGRSLAPDAAVTESSRSLLCAPTVLPCRCSCFMVYVSMHRSLPCLIPVAGMLARTGRWPGCRVGRGFREVVSRAEPATVATCGAVQAGMHRPSYVLPDQASNPVCPWGSPYPPTPSLSVPGPPPASLRLVCVWVSGAVGCVSPITGERGLCGASSICPGGVVGWGLQNQVSPLWPRPCCPGQRLPSASLA